MNYPRASSLDVIYFFPVPSSMDPVPPVVNIWRSIEMWLGIEWAEAKDRKDTLWTRGAFDGLVIVNQIRLSGGDRRLFTEGRLVGAR